MAFVSSLYVYGAKIPVLSTDEDVPDVPEDVTPDPVPTLPEPIERKITIEYDNEGRPEYPELMLQTLNGRNIGSVSGVSDLKFNIKFSDPSEISFTVSSVIDGAPNPIYEAVTGYKRVYTAGYGIYMLMNPETEADGFVEKKTVTGYSLQKMLENRRFYLAGEDDSATYGVYKFWDPYYPSDSILGRILEIADGWAPGYIDPSLSQSYRMLDSYDDDLLSFIQNTVSEKYRCVFTFDDYTKTISAFSIDQPVDTLPIWLDFDNLVKSVDVSEISDELVTAMYPKGDDDLDVRDANPIGAWIYDFSYFIANGDIPSALADKIHQWEEDIEDARTQFQVLVSKKYIALCSRSVDQANYSKLEQELNEMLALQTKLTSQYLVADEEEKESIQNKLSLLSVDISSKQEELSDCAFKIGGYTEELDSTNPNSYQYQINEIRSRLTIKNYFTSEEYLLLSNYLIEEDMTDTSFVCTDIDTIASGTSLNAWDSVVILKNAEIVSVTTQDEDPSVLYDIKGGTFVFGTEPELQCENTRCIVEKKSDKTFVLTLSGGSITLNGSVTTNSMITITGKYKIVIPNESRGMLIMMTSSALMFLTGGSGEYQRYVKSNELYEYAKSKLHESAMPAYEFSIDSANFLFASEFAPFRDSLALGKGLFLKLGEYEVIQPALIEFELSFEDTGKFSLVFSNRFKRRQDWVYTMKNMMERGYISGRNYNSNHRSYSTTVSATEQIGQYVSSSINLADIGWTTKSGLICNGSGSRFIAFNGSTTNSYADYFIWAGAEEPYNAPFWLKKNGQIHIANQ